MIDYNVALNKPNSSAETITKLNERKCRAFNKSHEARNDSTNANRRAKSAFYNSVNSVMKNPHISAKKKYGILITLMKNQKVSNIPPLIENNCTVTDPDKKANLLNKHFANISTVTGAADDPPILDKKEVQSDLSNLFTSPIEVAQIIRTMKKSNRSHCGIPGKFLSIIATPVSFPLCKLFNNMFEEGFYPDIFKLGHITAIWKQKGLKSSKLFYRPICLLPTLSKVCESVIHNRLLSHITENNLVTDRQAAYLKGDSTTNQLLYIVHLIRSAWATGKVAQGVFLDVHAAFDKVWHQGLLAKLEQNGVTGPCLNLFESYLSDRKQVVVVDGVKSNVEEVKAGIPQGSRLGPLLFILYINDITEGLESEVLIFADDTTLIATGINPEQTAAQLNRDLTRIKLWADKWKVIFNADKSVDMIFTKKDFPPSTPTSLNGTAIKRATSHRHLGVYLSTTLDWSVHVKQVCLRANRKLAVLRSVKGLNRATLDLLYKLTVRSVIDYALPVYFGTLKQTEIKRLNQIQYRAAKIVSGALHFSSAVKLNNELGWESLHVRYECLGLSLFHKIHLNLTRPLISKCMPEMNQQLFNTRFKFEYKPFPYKTLDFSNSFFPHFTKKWTASPTFLRNERDITEYKTKLKYHLKPKRYKFFNAGSKRGAALMTQLRVGRSFLNEHSFSISLSESANCSCPNAPRESTKHMLLKCPHYTKERQILMGKMEQLVLNFNSLTDTKKIGILLSGNFPDNPELYLTNKLIQISVQQFLINSKRFDKYQCQ
jgi:hypothetical protein